MTAPPKTPGRKRQPRSRATTARASSASENAEQAESAGLSDREIVRVAREIVAEVGVQGLTMRRLSNELGVALGATYHHVATKHELLLLLGRDLYGEMTSPVQTGSWQTRLKTLMVNVSSVVARYPGMAGFMMANVDELVPTDLNEVVRGILRDAGFTDEGISAVMSALFFYVTGMTAGGFADPTAKVFKESNMQALFEEGLDILVAGAEKRLEEDGKSKTARRSR